MSSKDYEPRTNKYVRKISLSNNYRRIKRKSQKPCPACKETNDCIKLLSNKVSKIEEIVDNFKNVQKKRTDKLSMFNMKFSLNDVPCELEYDLSKFTLENLQKLVVFTTKDCIPNKN